MRRSRQNQRHTAQGCRNARLPEARSPPSTCASGAVTHATSFFYYSKTILIMKSYIEVRSRLNPHRPLACACAFEGFLPQFLLVSTGLPFRLFVTRFIPVCVGSWSAFIAFAQTSMASLRSKVSSARIVSSLDGRNGWMRTKHNGVNGSVTEFGYRSTSVWLYILLQADLFTTEHVQQ